MCIDYFIYLFIYLLRKREIITEIGLLKNSAENLTEDTVEYKET